MANNITPRGVVKRIKDIIDGVYDIDEKRTEKKAAQDRKKYEILNEKQLEAAIKRTEKEMLESARNLEFEKAAQLRDELRSLRNKLLILGGSEGEAA